MEEILFLTSTMHEKIWGGSRLKSEFGYDIPSDKTGEYWAISAHEKGVSIIANGTFKGYKLDELYAGHKELFGENQYDKFPLLIKIIDANNWLSVQVHPDDAYALKNENEFGKTECWYILSAEENAEIIYGHHAKSKEELCQMITDKAWDKLFRRVKVNAGDFFYVPSGTMHAIGPGIMILEIQQSSDITYRIYDFERINDKGTQRELHIQQALEVLAIGTPQNTLHDMICHNGLEQTLLVSNEFFTVYKWKVQGRVAFNQFAPYLLVSVISGNGSLLTRDCCYSLFKGQHFIIPNNVLSWSIDGNIEMIVNHV
ncbi:mannose-6-phosphate isomerase, class I [Aerococcaceae bacterium zg-B36]|uniref:mannose-6-phosphate isomerase, class I n=1 Tax=Aerococcaceae bacterium zg-252 TaxID=2796928 RepID=UPI001BD7FFAA|nr:mannose-6-phosphate isomerase, class I [Aerococcaceae bacterium zg-B36]